VDTHLLEVPKVCGLPVTPETLLQMPLLKSAVQECCEGTLSPPAERPPLCGGGGGHRGAV
jgi:hypothetical protein